MFNDLREFINKAEELGQVNRVEVYVVSKSRTIRPSKIVDTLKAMPLLPGGSIIVPSDC